MTWWCHYIFYFRMDELYLDNCDWDPVYLASIFDIEFDDLSDMWNCENSLSDTHLSSVMDTFESENEVYCLIVEDISMDDITLCQVVDKIEKE